MPPSWFNASVKWAAASSIWRRSNCSGGFKARKEIHSFRADQNITTTPFISEHPSAGPWKLNRLAEIWPTRKRAKCGDDQQPMAEDAGRLSLAEVYQPRAEACA